MAQATPETSRMVGSLSGNPIPLLIPIVLTCILCRKYPVSFKNHNLFVVLIIYIIWTIASLIKYKSFSIQELSFYFFMLYAIVIAYIHCQIYGNKILYFYEIIMVDLCKIAIVLWAIAVLFPLSSSFFHLFPETRYGNNVLYLFNWMDPAKGQILRNAGCSWEPGRFAIMVSLAIFCNLSLNGIKFKQNKNIWWLLIALGTTLSTTGYSAVLALYVLFVVNKLNTKNIFLFVFIVLPIAYGIWQLDFMKNKISTKLTDAQDVSGWNEMFVWNARHSSQGEYLGSIDRFDAMSFEWLNVIHDPLLGYSLNIEHSYFRTNLSQNYVLANGLVKILGMYGLIMGLYWFYLLGVSSYKISLICRVRSPFALFILICLSAISYPVLSVPVFTTFWLYGIFTSNKTYLIN